MRAVSSGGGQSSVNSRVLVVRRRARGSRRCRPRAAARSARCVRVHVGAVGSTKAGGDCGRSTGCSGGSNVRASGRRLSRRSGSRCRPAAAGTSPAVRSARARPSTHRGRRARCAERAGRPGRRSCHASTMRTEVGCALCDAPALRPGAATRCERPAPRSRPTADTAAASPPTLRRALRSCAAPGSDAARRPGPELCRLSMRRMLWSWKICMARPSSR